MTRKIYFDMDGTIADLYGCDNWLYHLVNEHTKPYREAKPLVDMRVLGKEIKRLQNLGYTIGIISWLSKNATKEYNERVTKAKNDWLKRHLSAVQFNEIHIIEYGTPKYKYGNGILFDDEIGNRENWNAAEFENFAFTEKNIIEILRGLV